MVKLPARAKSEAIGGCTNTASPNSPINKVLCVRLIGGIVRVSYSILSLTVWSHAKSDVYFVSEGCPSQKR